MLSLASAAYARQLAQDPLLFFRFWLASPMQGFFGILPELIGFGLTPSWTRYGTPFVEHP